MDEARRLLNVCEEMPEADYRRRESHLRQVKAEREATAASIRSVFEMSWVDERFAYDATLDYPTVAVGGYTVSLLSLVELRPQQGGLLEGIPIVGKCMLLGLRFEANEAGVRSALSPSISTRTADSRRLREYTLAGRSAYGATWPVDGVRLENPWVHVACFEWPWSGDLLIEVSLQEPPGEEPALFTIPTEAILRRTEEG
jgi:hypothetical protein